ELLEALAILIEERPGTGNVERHADQVDTDHVSMLAHIGFRDQSRILDDRTELPREQLIESAVEGDARYNRDQYRGDSSNDREQGDDAHVQPRGGASAAARLKDEPSFQRNDGEETDDGGGVAGKRADAQVMGRNDRGKSGGAQEGHQRGQQRHPDGDWAKNPKSAPPRRKAGRRHFKASRLVDAGHEVVR